MPQSWIRVSRGTSEQLARCLGDDNSDPNFERCVHEIVRGEGASVLEFRHVGHGRFSLVKFDAPDEARKRAVIRDLDAEEVDDPGPARDAAGAGSGG